MPDFNLTRIEEEIQKFWGANSVPDKILSKNRGKKKFVFYEGPPTANGLPHIGHLLTRAFKDLFIRYKTMRGFDVPRRAGWDTHGLPVEIEVEKELGLKNKKEIEEYGVAGFNKKARESVWRYKGEWEKFSKRIGFWLDFDNPYITYDNGYIESLWWVIKQFSDKKLLYKDYKVVPYCPRCGTPLSTHELGQDDAYRTVKENSVYVKFKIKNWADTYILSWTTTPWTLPGNVALAVGKDIVYAVAEQSGKNYILAKDLVEEVFKDTRYKIQNKKYKGSDLVGLEYEPLFEVPSLKDNKSYKIYDADFVSTEEGTGVVHTAVMYGEDDFRLGTKVGLPKFHTVDEEGKFVKGLGYGLDGLEVKSPRAEETVISHLKKENLLLKEKEYEHDYPFCWRCKHPLLYYAIDSWFAKTTEVKKRLVSNNKKINWIPSYIKEGRFGQWLGEVKDWAFSRDRFWGTPLPVWQCQECEENLVVGSLEELEKRRYRKPNNYFILRHTEKGADKNLAEPDVISSKLEHDKYGLTEKGVEDARKLGEKLKGKVDLILSSPFLRTKKTAQIIADILGLEVKIDERLKELDHGSVCEGKDHMVCLPDKSYPPGDFNQKFGSDGESWNDVRKRMFTAIKELEEKHEGKNILIVSHGDPLWLLEGMSLNSTDKELFDLKLDDKKYIKTGELRNLDFKNLPRNEIGGLDLHRPYVDAVALKCPTRLPDGQECEGEMKRVSDVVDVWFDSGSMPFASKADFPADFITEGVDQTRGWFYTLLAVSTLLGKSAPYKNVISLGHVLDKEGKKMSKSLGNVITPQYAIDKFGSDTTRWWFYKVNQAGESKSFREEELKDVQSGLVRVLVNSLRFWQLYHETDNTKHETKINFHKIDSKSLTLLDRWFLSKWNSLVFSVTESLDEYDATTASRAIEKFVIEDLSNWWIRRSRDKFQSGGGYEVALLRFVLLELAKLIAPFVPFLAEYLHKELHRGTVPGTASVHFHDWPEVNKKLIDKKLEEEMESAREIASLGLAARKETGVKVRQPLANLKVRNFQFSRLRNGQANSNFQKELVDLIKEEVNVKEVIFENGREGDLTVNLDTEITPALRTQGWVREFMRMIQDARKDAGYDFKDEVSAFWFSEEESLAEAIKRESESIKKKTILKELQESRHDSTRLPAGQEFAYDVEKEQEIEPGRKIWLGLKK